MTAVCFLCFQNGTYLTDLTIKSHCVYMFIVFLSLKNIGFKKTIAIIRCLREIVFSFFIVKKKTSFTTKSRCDKAKANVKLGCSGLKHGIASYLEIVSLKKISLKLSVTYDCLVNCTVALKNDIPIEGHLNFLILQLLFHTQIFDMSLDTISNCA